MRGLGNGVACFIQLGLTALLIHLQHFVGVTVVGGDQRNAAQLIDDGQDAGKLQVQCLHGATGCQKRAGMTDHIAVGKVDAQVLICAALQSLDQLVGDLGALHPGTLLEGNDVGGNLNIGLQLLGELARLITVPEIGDVAVLLRLGDGELGDAVIGKILGHGVGDLGRVDQIAMGNMQVTVVLQHAGKQNGGNANAIKGIKATVAVKGAGDLDGAVAAEVEEDDAVAVLDRTDGLAALGDNECRQILVQDAGDLGAVGGDGSLCALKGAPLAKHVRLPACLDHAPVCFVSVHGDLHTAAAGGDTSVEIGVVQSGEECLEGTDILQCGGGINVTAVQQNVDADGLDAIFLCLLDHCSQMIDVRVDVTVGEQTDEVQRGAVVQHLCLKGIPGVGGEHFTRFDGIGYQLCALCEDLSRAECVMADLGVAHVIVRGKTDGSAVCLEGDHGIFCHEHIQRRRVCAADCVGECVGGDTDAVHDDGNDGTLDTVELFQLVECFHIVNLLPQMRQIKL